jgi:hypothetical protein
MRLGDTFVRVDSDKSEFYGATMPVLLIELRDAAFITLCGLNRLTPEQALQVSLSLTHHSVASLPLLRHSPLCTEPSL